MTKRYKFAALAAAAFAVAAPGFALAQTTGTRLPTTTVEPVVVIGAIDDGSQAVRGEEAADAAMAELPVAYDDAPAASEAPVTPARK